MSFLHYVVLGNLVKGKLTKIYGFISGISFLFHCSPYLYLNCDFFIIIVLDFEAKKYSISSFALVQDCFDCLMSLVVPYTF